MTGNPLGMTGNPLGMTGNPIGMNGGLSFRGGRRPTKESETKTPGLEKAGSFIFNGLRKDYSPGAMASAGQTPAQVPQSMQTFGSML